MISLLINEKRLDKSYVLGLSIIHELLSLDSNMFHVLLLSIILADFSGDKFTSMGPVVIGRFLFLYFKDGWLAL